MTVTGHDIRMKEFKRAFLRGYAAEDVDTFLMYLAVEMDRRERYYRALTLDDALPAAPAVSPPSAGDELFDATDTADTDRLPPPPVTDDVPHADAQVQADAIPHADAQAQADAIPHADAQAHADAIIAEARARAERGIERAKDHAREIVAAARQRQAQVEQAEAEVSLRLAHLEQRMAERAAVLSTEARRLDELAASLAERDLAPALEEYHTPAHAAPGDGADVVPLARTADD